MLRGLSKGAEQLRKDCPEEAAGTVWLLEEAEELELGVLRELS